MKVLVEAKTRRLLYEGILYPVEKPVMSAPTVPVIKQAGAKHPISICSDYSMTLNEVIVPDSYRIPKLEEIPIRTSCAVCSECYDTTGCFAKFFKYCLSALYTAQSQHLLKVTTSYETAIKTLLANIAKGQFICYDQMKPLFVFSDASQNSLGYVLAHDAHQKEVVWLDSRVLTPAEVNYSNVERKALGLIKAVKYFHEFLSGHMFTLCTDHRALQYIFCKCSVPDRVSACLQYWSLTLHADGFVVQYIRGENMFAADTLSRIPQRNLGSDISLTPVVDLLEVNGIHEFMSHCYVK